ncbi:unnamed protein product [Acanthoscelides obtectus]|uniref:HIT domain-containing protein n=1 Tax=Acanthoscelides obtectus TaxID=200917 RepID=A0A9P0PNV3_ACAOB|nr:unnamed protein product [Acanthoscelides obtectus]CAK1638544.1 hypothetical protein AOBTE_LOCUS10657 [Acanthoscelides obtectus]
MLHAHVFPRLCGDPPFPCVSLYGPTAFVVVGV